MKIVFNQKMNENQLGCRQLLIDFAKKEYQVGFFLTVGYDVKQLSKRQIDDLIEWLKMNGFQPLINVSIK